MIWPGNKLLSEFGSDLGILRPDLREVGLTAGQVLRESGERIREVYFPQSGMISQVAVFSDGTEIECAFAGREGAAGAYAALGLRVGPTRDVCHLPARAYRVDADRLQEAAMLSERIHDVLHRYCASKLGCVMRSAACNALHPVEQRLCRWMLTCSDVLEQSAIPLSQDVFASMLGVQRTSVNPILQRLRAEGLVELGRSRITLLDRDGLMARTCECYAAMKAAESQSIPPAAT